MPPLYLGFLASHGGSNMQAIIDACKTGRLEAKPCVVISNNSDSMALQRAKNEGIPNYHVSAVTHPGRLEDEEILRTLKRHGVDTVILAGYMKMLGPATLRAYGGRILNIHPALLPKYGGKGMYGKRVHEDDTVDSLAERVLKQEHLLYVETLQKIVEGKIVLGK